MPRRLGAVSVVVSASLVLAACSAGRDAAAPGSEDAEVEGVTVEDGEADGQPNEESDDGSTGDGRREPELVTEGTLTVCTEATYPPFVFADDDSPAGYSGFDLELLTAIAETADLVSITLVEVGFEDITSGAAFEAGRCDAGASAIPITEARAERVDFTDPYYTSRQSLLVRSGSDIAELDDLTQGMVIGVQTDTSAADRAAEHVEGAEIRTYDDGEALFAAFDDGELDAVLHDLEVNAARAHDDDASVAERYERVEELGFVVARERPDDLLRVLNDGLQQVRDDGTYDELVERFFGLAP